MKRLVIITCGAALCAPQVAEAHVKWFCAYDTSIPPLPWGAVFTPVFLFIATAFAGLMFASYLIDRVVERNGWLERIERGMLRCRPAILPFMRVAVGGFFLTLWMRGGVILTPELTTTSDWVPWLQLAIAASTLWRPTLVFTAAGITALYLYGVAEYGAFHMMDYPVFLGIAAYLGFSAFDRPELARLRLPALYFNVALTMMWGAIEKFGYPCWTFPLMATHGALTLGIPFDWFMVIAGFVEFSLAFFMLTGTALLRLASLALLALLVSAVPEFGMVDAIGHALIIVVLGVMIVAGQRGIGVPALLRRDGVVMQSSVMTMAYGATMLLLFAIYYSSQYIAGR